MNPWRYIGKPDDGSDGWLDVLYDGGRERHVWMAMEVTMTIVTVSMSAIMASEMIGNGDA